MKITEPQLVKIIKEELKKLKEAEGVEDSMRTRVPPEYVEELTGVMTKILDWVESVSHPESDWHPDDVPARTLEVIEGEVASFTEYLNTGYVNDAWSVK